MGKGRTWHDRYVTGPVWSRSKDPERFLWKNEIEYIGRVGTELMTGLQKSKQMG